MPAHVIRRGLDLPILGEATGIPVDLPPPATVAYCPAEFRGVFAKPVAKVGDEVQAGGVLFCHKQRPEMKFLSPVAGRVQEIRRGRRRVITDYVVERTGDEAVELRRFELEQLQELGRDDARSTLLAGGLWPCLRTRPLDQVADPDDTPQSILIGAMQTSPLQPGMDELVGPDQAEAMQAGVHVLAALTDGPVYLATESGTSHPALRGLKDVELHSFRGPHPAGDPGVQVNHVDPPRGGRFVWWVRAWDVVLIGRLFLEGRFPAERIYAAIGAGVRHPRLVRTVLGAPLADIVGDINECDDLRWIRGSVLTGTTTSADRWAGFYDRAVHLLPTEAPRELWGWITPQFKKFSSFRATFTGLLGAFAKPYDMRPILFGGPRAMVPHLAYAGVIASPDIQPEFLFRSILAGDLEDAIGLGLLDITEEEAALMTFVCPAKIEYTVALRDMLDTYVKET